MAPYRALESAEKLKDALRNEKRSFKEVLVISLGSIKPLEKEMCYLNCRNEVSGREHLNPKSKLKKSRVRYGRTESNKSNTYRTNHRFEQICGIGIDLLQLSLSKQK